jgi:hypothetical protein
MTWAIIIGLIVVGGLASAVWPAISAQLNIGRSGELAAARPEPEPIVLNVEDHLIGELLVVPGLGDFLMENVNGLELSQPVVIGILIAVTVGSLVLLGGPLAFIYAKLETQASAVQEDETYKLAVSALEKRQTAELKEQRQAKPAHIEANEADDRRGFAYTMAFLVIIFAWVVGAVIGHAAYGGELIATRNGQLINPVSISSLIVLAITLAGFFVYFRWIRKPEEIDPAATDYAPVAWGWVWVIVSGLLIVGVGAGLALNLIASGGPPPG